MDMSIKNKNVTLVLLASLSFYCFAENKIPSISFDDLHGYFLLNDTTLNKITFTGKQITLLDAEGYLVPKNSDNKIIETGNVTYIKDTENLTINSAYGGTCKTSTSNPTCNESAIDYIIMDGGNASSLIGIDYFENTIGSNKSEEGSSITGIVYVNGGHVDNKVYGAIHYNQQPSGNIVTNGAVYINDGFIGGGIESAFSHDYGYHLSNNDDIQKSTVNGLTYINGGTINGSIQGAISYISSFDASYGTANSYIEVNGGIINGDIKGSFSQADAHDAVAIANGNLYINDGTINGDTTVANAQVFDTFNDGFITGSATANGNAYINGGIVNGSISGAIVQILSTQNNNESIANAVGNIYFYNGTISGRIIGAIANGSTTGSNSTTTIYANGNISIFNNAKLQEDNGGITYYNSEIWGGYLVESPDYYDVFSNNTLSIGSNPLTIKKMGNIENYNFYINDYSDIAINHSGIALVKVTDLVKNDNTILVNNGGIEKTNTSSVQIVGISGKNKVKANDSIVLINAEGAMLNQDDTLVSMSDLFANTPKSNTITIGVAHKAEVSYVINDTSQTISAVINRVSVNEDVLKPLAEGRVAALQNITRNNDLLITALGNKKPVGTFTPIAIINGGINKYHSGSYIDTRDYRMAIGSQYQFTEELHGGLTLEYSRSNYDTYNDFASGEVHGKGHTYNYGFSLFTKYIHEVNIGHTYIDTTASFGRTSTAFSSNDIITGSGNSAHYKSKANYLSGSVAIGYVYTVNDTSGFDTSIRYLYTHLAGDSVVVDGDKVNFNNSSSSRVQFKEQYNYQSSETLTFYLAGIYEYETKGKATTNISGVSVNAPSLQGSTGIMELGVKGMPIEGNKNVSIYANVKGYGGKRDGASISASIKYDF